MSDNKEGIIGFLRRKFSSYRFSELLRLEIEGWLIWLCGSFPGMIGFVLRNAVYKLLFKRKGGFAWIQPRVTLVHTDRLKCGKHLGVNSGTYINAVGGITMGDYVLIGSNVTISSGRHPVEGEEPPIFCRPVEPFPIVIEDGVWIGAGAVIMPNVTLKRGTVVGANAVVTHSTEEYAIVVGMPARQIRKRDDYR